MVKYKHGKVFLSLAEELRKNIWQRFKHIVMLQIGAIIYLQLMKKSLKQTGGYFEREAPEMFTFECCVVASTVLMILLLYYFSASAAKAYFDNEDL